MQYQRGRILFVTSNFPRWRGDATTPFVLNLAEDLQALGWKVSVLAPHAAGAAIEETINGVQVRRFRYLWPASAQTVCYDGGALLKYRNNPLSLLKILFLVVAEWVSTVKELIGGSTAVVHSHWILPQGFTAGMACMLMRVPHVTTVHGGDVFSLRGALFQPFKRIALRLSNAVTVNSSATRFAVQEIYPAVENVHLIPMGAEVRAAETPDLSRDLAVRLRRGAGPLIAFVGRLVEEKGVADLIRATALLASRFPDLITMIIGDGPDRSRFELLARQLGVDQRVRFEGWIDPKLVPDYLAAADLFVGPSKAAADGWVEAQGVVFIEALLAKLPVIATDTGGIADVLRHEQTGLLVPQSSPGAIADAVARLVENPGLARQLAQAGYTLVRDQYSRAASARRFDTLYRAVLGNS